MKHEEERRNVLHIMHDSELIRRCTLDHAGIMFVTDLIKDMYPCDRSD